VLLIPVAVSTLAIVLIVLAVVIALFFVGGLLGARRRSQRQAATFEQRVAAADHALEAARAADRGWHPEAMEAAAKQALEEARPGWGYSDLHLVLVDDKPGVEEDRAHYVAVGEGGEAHVIIARTGDRWVAERVE
jgi:type II secretory pathway pseudopilin PulG